jgi:methylmalonyl-CoA mutase C-terminal domain/subunit
MSGKRKLRILVAKPGLDGHDRGARVIARAFRDAGFEVVYTGCHQTPEQIVSTALQEDVDLIGLSILSGAHTYSFPRVMELLQENNARDITVIGGGIFPLEDVPKLKAIGIREIFEPGAKLKDITDWIAENVKPRGAMVA